MTSSQESTVAPKSTALQVVFLLGVLVMFFTSLELMGDSFKLMGSGVAESLLRMTSNPFVGLFIGILATSLVQSSSTTTTLTVSLVAAGGLDIAGAIPIIMGANIGTSVTNTIVSLGSVTRKEEFRRAMAGATVHDFFNFLAVATLFPLELMFKFVSTPAAYLTDSLATVGGTQLLSPVKEVTEPIAEFVIGMAGENGIIVLIAGLALLFLSLRFLVTLLKSLVLGRSEQFLHKYIFGQPAVSLLFGVALTFLVQSSSITTSLTVPLVGAGILTVTQIYPFVLGANVGTTMTAIVAALVLASAGEPGSAEALRGVAAVKVALAHLFFNVYGIALFLPIKRLRQIPIRLSEKLGDLAVKNRGYALGYLATVFFAIPLITIVSTRNLEFTYDPPKPDRLEQAPGPSPASEAQPTPAEDPDTAAPVSDAGAAGMPDGDALSLNKLARCSSAA
jgi:sodium-dependent phosphate cotransporter